MHDSPSAAHTALIPRLLIRLVAAVCQVPRTILAISTVLAIVSVYAFYTQLEYRTQRSDLMNPHKDYQQRWRQYLAEFGDDDDMVVVVEGTDRGRMEAALEQMAGDVGPQTDLFDRLFYKVDLRHLQNRALLFLPAEQIQSIQDNLQRMGPLLNGPIGALAWKGLTLVNLLKQARERAGKIDPSAPLDPADEQFLTQLLAVVPLGNGIARQPGQLPQSVG